jgi:hypothetical protein
VRHLRVRRFATDLSLPASEKMRAAQVITAWGPSDCPAHDTNERAIPQVHVFQGPYFTLSPRPRLRSLALLAALALSFLVSAQGADARLKSEWKFGGNLTRALMSIPIASAVLGDVSELDGASLPSTVQPAGGSLEGLFNRHGVIGGFAAGFLGAGVIGVLFGHGMVGEISGAAAILGLLLQLTLLIMLGRLIWSWWRADKASAFADLSPRQLADAYGRSRNETLPDIEPGGNGNPAGAANDPFSTNDRARP